MRLILIFTLMGFGNWLLFCFSNGTDKTLVRSNVQIIINIIAVHAVKLFFILEKVKISFLSNAQLQTIDPSYDAW